MELKLRGAAGSAALCCLIGAAAFGAPSAGAQAPVDAAYAGDVMWVHVLARSSGGSPRRMARTARRYGIETVTIKGAGGTRRWRQLSRRLVDGLQARGLKVCGYHRLFGRRPRAEARLSASVIGRSGVDCFVIDAESELEGRYVAAQTYMRALRRAVGPRYPLGLTSFPYVHLHPRFPYSVFLGPGGADFNVPQVYWRAIGTSVGRAVSITYRMNRVYGRPIRPLGQVWMHPPRRELLRFRRLIAARGAPGAGWWVWQLAARRDWRAIAAPIEPPARQAPPTYPRLARGARGDLVAWAQQHLVSAGEPVRVSGVFGPGTRQAVRRFQMRHGLPITGRLDSATWPRLLPYNPTPVTWRRRGGAIPTKR